MEVITVHTRKDSFKPDSVIGGHYEAAAYRQTHQSDSLTLNVREYEILNLPRQ
jgi:hypothetical protein